MTAIDVSGVPPKFFAFEGGEGSGKSTQAAHLAARLGAVLTREPGGTVVGTAIRNVLIESAGFEDLDPKAEMLLMAADRAQHFTEVIVPALFDQQRHVVSDRSGYSSIAYQGFGRGLDLGTVTAMSNVAYGGGLDYDQDVGHWPELVVYLTLDFEERRRRRAERRGRLDRFEAAEDDFHRRLDAGFESMISEEPDRWVVVDGNGSVMEVADRVWAAVTERLVGPFDN